MNAIRKDEQLDNLHSIYVDQWDRESYYKSKGIFYLKETVNLYMMLLKKQKHICSIYPSLNNYFLKTSSFLQQAS